MVVWTSVQERTAVREIVAFVKEPVIVCETSLVGKDISIQTFPTWHPKPVSGRRQERFCLGLWADCILRFGVVSSGALQRAVDHLIKGDDLVSPPLGSATLVHAFGDWSSGKVWTSSRALAAW